MKSNHQGRVSLASAKPDPPLGARRGGTPSASKFSSEKFSTKTTFVLFDYINNGILKTTIGTRKRQGRPSQGTPTPLGYGYLTHHLPRKVTLARIHDSAIDRQVVMLETRGEKTQLFKHDDKVFRPRRPRKSMRMIQTNCSCRFGHRQGEQHHPRCCFHPRRNLARPRTATWAKGPPPKGGRQHHASRCFGQAPAATATPSSAREAAVSRADEVSFRADSTFVHANTAASGSGSSQSSRGF